MSYRRSRHAARSSAPDEALPMHDRRSIRDRRGEGGTIRGMAREFGASRNAVRRALDPDAALQYQRPALADEYEPAVRDVLADYPRLAVPQIAEVIEWPGSRSTLSALVARLRPAALEREREDLNRPVLGRVIAGPLTIGHATVGTLIAGHLAIGAVAHGSTVRDITGPL